MIHIDKLNEQELIEKLEPVFRTHLDRQLKYGIAQGAYATCKVILDEIIEGDQHPEDKLRRIEQFCKTSIESVEKQAAEPEKAGD